MQPTSHQGLFPDRTKDPVSTQTSSSSQPHESPDPSPEAPSQQSWKPRFDRRQSWSNEDHKHQLQERLLDVKSGQQAGFTETGTGR
ncbi:hypothetical protein N7462_000374 [Penicillium macrosclerotiorum]|uniref:uncharacterized protein n=1 Tax=Penicillium macrosclerotiorum TaxID=303699 RepID=UPI002546E8D6|nr:uncharacterized protein N7462_000374 [Penicillium macrosclerotiorum]KAJ5698369.1 hypothetical protein N7462_000374 [Penicillium macrosclerotiorum]